MIRPQLIELTAARFWRSRKAASPNSAFTSAWQSSKLPSIATLWTLAAVTVVICRRWTSDTRPAGCRITIRIRSRPAQALIAAEPVSPEVAPTIVIARSRACRKCSNSRPRSCSATSLKASVGPWNSSSSQSLAASWRSGAIAAWPKPA